MIIRFDGRRLMRLVNLTRLFVNKSYFSLSLPGELI